MLDLIRSSLRGSVLATIAVALLLAVAALATYRTIGPSAAIILVTAGNGLLIATWVLVARRHAHRTDDTLRVAERALQAVPHALFVVDTAQPGRPNRFVNAAYSELTGYGAAEAVSDGFDALAVFTDPSHVATLANGLVTSTTSPVTVRRSDGATVAARLEFRSVPGSDGNHFVLGLLQATDSAERSAERHYGPQLELDSGNGEPAGRAKNAFLSWLTHELRSPLNACVMWLDVLALTPQPDKLTQAVEAIKRNLTRQTRIVNDLSDAAKIPFGGLEVQLAPLDLVALLNRHVDAWQLLAIGKQIAFEHRIEPSSARIDADADRLLQALNHLLDNAIVSTPAGGNVQLRVHCDPDACIVQVEDSGVGLSPEDAANLSRPLWRAPAAAKSRPGLGLGLAVACHLAAKHRGTLTATSKSAGVLFTLTLPLATAGDRNP